VHVFSILTSALPFPSLPFLDSHSLKTSMPPPPHTPCLKHPSETSCSPQPHHNVHIRSNSTALPPSNSSTNSQMLQNAPNRTGSGGAPRAEQCGLDARTWMRNVARERGRSEEEAGANSTGACAKRSQRWSWSRVSGDVVEAPYSRAPCEKAQARSPIIDFSSTATRLEHTVVRTIP
jgi:hypothetical protein